MGIDYVVDLPCAPKQRLGTDGLVRLVKARSRAHAVLELARQGGDRRAPGELAVEVLVETPDGTRAEALTVQAMLDQAAPLDALAPSCAGCPAAAGRAFGCHDSIPYPIPEAAEAWLLGRLPDDLGTTAGQLLVRALADLGWDGALAAELRAQGDTFFEREDALAVRWGDAAGAPTVDTDQVFHMLFHLGALGATHALMLCVFFGVLPHDVDVAVLRDDDARAEALAAARPPEPPDDACAPLARFLAALAVAARLDVDVLIDG